VILGEPNRLRWERAQAAELRWWQNWSHLPFYRNHSFQEHWTRVVSELIGDPESVPPCTIVEVGCGPHGIVRYLFKNARFKLGVDPLLCRFNDGPGSDCRTGFVAAVGEAIPVKDEVADLVFCINVLDHVMDADQILREIWRILKPGGKFLLEVHTFPRILTPVMFFDRPHTFHWSHSDATKMAKKAGYRILEMKTERFPIELSLASWFNPGHWKYIFGKMFMRLSYVYCEK
jgi:ubiquinone/menaquinone biosynthesis C-methylase UbiE